MKLGIITLYESQNYGAFLQAYAMCSYLNQSVENVEFIKLPFPKLKQYWNMVKTKNIPLALFRVRQELKYIVSRKSIRISDKNSIKYKYDLIVVGSDTLWDVQNNSYPHFEYFLGYDLNCEKIIAYAPSCNSTTCDDFKAVYGKRAHFTEFSNIAVRDKKTQELVLGIENIEPQIVVDPTFLIDIDSYPKKIIKKPYKYVLIYSYGFSENQREKIKAYCRKNGLKTLSVGIWNSWCDYNVTATVQEFLGYMEKAEAVITSTFHGTIFSMLLGKRYAVYADDNYKVNDILEKTGNQHHDATNADLEEILLYDDDQRYSNEFKKEIKNSKAFLEQYLS